MRLSILCDANITLWISLDYYLSHWTSPVCHFLFHSLPPHVKVRESKCFQNGHHITNALKMTTILIFFICKKIQNYSRKIYHKIHLYISSLFSGYSRKLINKKNEISAVFSLILTYHQLCLPLVTLKKSDYKLWYVQRYYSLYKMGGWDKITINKINCVLSNWNADN